MRKLEDAHQRATGKPIPAVPASFAWIITKINKATQSVYVIVWLYILIFLISMQACPHWAELPCSYNWGISFGYGGNRVSESSIQNEGLLRMVQTRAEGNSHGTEELESIVDWKAANRSLIEIGIDKVTAPMEDVAHDRSAHIVCYKCREKLKYLAFIHYQSSVPPLQFNCSYFTHMDSPNSCNPTAAMSSNNRSLTRFTICLSSHPFPWSLC